jgi:hypothetical protein
VNSNPVIPQSVLAADHRDGRRHTSNTKEAWRDWLICQNQPVASERIPRKSRTRQPFTCRDTGDRDIGITAPTFGAIWRDAFGPFVERKVK